MHGGKKGPFHVRVLRSMLAEGIQMRPQARRSGSRRRKDRGARASKQFCWCGFEMQARRGHLRCPAHQTGASAPPVGIQMPPEGGTVLARGSMFVRTGTDTAISVDGPSRNYSVSRSGIDDSPHSISSPQIGMMIKERRKDSAARNIVEVADGEYVAVASVGNRTRRIAWKNLKRYDVVR